jgi:TRAP-type uncharacterized transport system substrate-binding protein
MKIQSREFPLWVRAVLLAGVLFIVVGAGLVTYRSYTRPTVLTVAVGSLDAQAGKSIAAIAGRLAVLKAPVRLKLVNAGDMASAAQAFGAGHADLALVRADYGNLADARSVVLVSHSVVLIVAPPGSPIASITDLKAKVLGVVGGAINGKIVDALKAEYALGADITAKDLRLNDARRAITANEVGALLFTIPLTEKYLSVVRELFPQGAPVLIPVDSAGAIADAQGAYESFDLPKGTLRGAPPVPSDDLTTLRVSYFLVANKNLDSDLVANLTQAIMDARSSLLAEQPELSSIAAPDDDANAHIPIHPGASAFFNGNQQSFMDRYGNAIYLTPMILGGFASVFAAAWRFLGISRPASPDATMATLYALPRRIRRAATEADLAAIEEEIDEMLKTELARAARGDSDALDPATLNAAAHRMDNLIHHRRFGLSQAARTTS